jgi:hypothetical protein
MRVLLPALRVEQNDRAFGSLDRASAFLIPAFQLPIERRCAFLIRRPDCLIGRPDPRRALAADRTDCGSLRRIGSA